MRSLIASAALLLAVACSGSNHTAAPTSTTSATTTTMPTMTTTSTITSVPATTAPSPAGAGCRSPKGAVPAGVAARSVPDVDDDGRTDQAFFNGVTADGSRRFVIVTAAGGRAEADLQSASPVAATALVVNADERGSVEILISDNRTVSLFAFVDCTITMVKNAQGAQYQFDLGFRGTGTGVGCAASTSGRQLVGLNVTGDDGTTVHWKRTVITVSGTSARNGATTTGSFTRPRDDAAIALLSTVSCGDRTMAADGVSEPL